MFSLNIYAVQCIQGTTSNLFIDSVFSKHEKHVCVNFLISPQLTFEKPERWLWTVISLDWFMLSQPNSFSTQVWSEKVISYKLKKIARLRLDHQDTHVSLSYCDLGSALDYQGTLVNYGTVQVTNDIFVQLCNGRNNVRGSTHVGKWEWVWMSLQ